MAGQSRDYEILIQMRADMAAGIAALQKVQGELRKTSDSAGAIQASAAKATAAISGIGARAGAVGASLKKMAGALVAAFAVREFAGFVKNVIDADAALGDMSKKVGVSTETLSALGQVARRNGSDLNAVKTGFVKLAQAATDGGSKGAKALQAMGIPLKQFLAMTASEQFDTVAQKFAGYEDGARKAALATALFGKSGADLIPTLNEVGQQGLQNITDKAIAAGTAIGQKGADAAQKFQNALQTLKDKLQGATTEGLAQFTPYVEHLTDLLNDPEFQKNLTATANGIAAIATAAIDAANKLVGVTRGLAEIAGYKTTGVIASDTGYMAALSELDKLQTEAQRRAKPGINLDDRSLTLAFFDNTQSQSDAKLQERIAQLKAQIAEYRKQTTQPPKNPQEGDTRGLLFPLGNNQAPIVGNGSGNDAAAKLARDAAAAQQQLTQSLIDLQGQLDPTAAIYAKFNDTVKKATDEAELAKKAHGANAQAIDSQRDAVVALAGRVRDAALDQLAEKDRLAWEALKRSFETPAQVRVEDALKQIRQLNDLLEKGVITAAQYHDALGQIGQKSVAGALPQYQGVDAAVGGNYGELQKNYEAQTTLDAAYQAQKLALDKQFDDTVEAQHEAHLAAMAALDNNYKNENAKIEQSRGTLQLNAASTLFGQLATLSTSHNKKMAAIGKAASIAQAIIDTYQSATAAYKAMAGIPVVGPALGVAAAAAAVAAGLANVAQIRSQNTGSGYSEGGYTGPGAVNQPAGIVHAGEVVWSQADVRRAGGVGMVEGMRLRGYADGGFVHPLAGAPSPADLGFSLPEPPRMSLTDLRAANDGAPSRAPAVNVKTVMVMNADQLADEILNTPTGTKLVVQHVGDNPRSIQGKWNR